MEATRIREAFLSGAASLRGDVPSEEVTSVKVAAAEKADKPRNYAFRAGVNWAKDLVRKQSAAKKREAEIAAYKAKVAFEQVARAELRAILVQLAGDHALHATRLHWIGVLRLVYVEGVPTSDLGDYFPGMAADAIYQWKHRGLELISPLVSNDLKVFLHSLRGHRFQKV